MWFDDMFDNFFDDWFTPYYTYYDPKYEKKLSKALKKEIRNDTSVARRAARMMKTDVKEVENGYEVAMDLPGFKKEDISAKLENGYLTITAFKGLDKDEKNEEGKYIRRERYSGSCSRSCYVGDGVTVEDIKARFEDGILKLDIPKKDAEKIEQKKYISIEG